MQNPYKLLRTVLPFAGGMFLLSAMFSSCGTTRDYTYMQGKFDTAALSQVHIPDPTIQKGDLLSVIVYSDNIAATAIYNQPLIVASAASGGGAGGEDKSGGSSVIASTGTSPTAPGYLVDDMGNIEFQGLGLLHVEGLTRSGLKQLLDSSLKKYLTNPYYTIRFMNYKFTMLGEVNRQGVYSIPGDHISLLEALGLAGDVTFYGRRDNVLIIRETNGKREFGRVNLTKPDMLASPYFYLQQGDVVYVEQTKKKIAASDAVTTRNITLGLAIVSTLVIVYSVLKK